MGKKILKILCLVIVMLGSICGCSGKKEEEYRIIQVLEVSGTVSIERTDMGTMEAYEGMRLQSGDVILVGAESWLKFQMDEDKFALAEPDTRLRLEASGSSTDSKTVIHLEEGAISNRIEKKLSEKSTYEVSTPNSVMAVRGTSFRVSVRRSGDSSITDVRVLSGNIETVLKYPDGTVDEKEKAVKLSADSMAGMRGDRNTSVYLGTDNEADLSDLPLQTLEFLQESNQTEKYAERLAKDIDETIQKRKAEMIRQKTESEQEAVSEQQTKKLKSDEDKAKNETKKIDQTTKIQKRPAPARVTPPVTEPETPPVTEPETPPVTEPETPPVTEPETPPVTEPETPPATEPETPPATEPETPPVTEPETPPATEPETPPEPEETPASYTVTFQYDNTIFATQTVESGQYAQRPILQPTASGEWNSDFETAITANITIEWIPSETDPTE